MEGVVLHGAGYLEYFCAKQEQDSKSSSAPLHSNMGQVTLPSRTGGLRYFKNKLCIQQQSLQGIRVLYKLLSPFPLCTFTPVELKTL